MRKWLPVAGAWMASDVYSALQLGWLKHYMPQVYDGVMNFVVPISVYLHTFVVSSWHVVKTVIVDIVPNTS